MTRSEYIFPRRKAVLQVFRHSTSMLKGEWRSSGRREALLWPEAIVSTTGGVVGNRVVLNESVRRVPQDFAASDIIIINDLKIGPLPNPMPTVDDRELRLLPLMTPRNVLGEWWNRPSDQVLPPAYDLLIGAGGSRSYEVFNICRTTEGLDLFLDYSGHACSIGSPRRADFRVAVLRENQPVRVILNGREPTWTETHYNLFDYIFIYLGDFDLFEVRPWNEMPAQKIVPVNSAKVVDLEQQLY